MANKCWLFDFSVSRELIKHRPMFDQSCARRTVIKSKASGTQVSRVIFMVNNEVHLARRRVERDEGYLTEFCAK